MNEAADSSMEIRIRIMEQLRWSSWLDTCAHFMLVMILSCVLAFPPQVRTDAVGCAMTYFVFTISERLL